MVHDFNPSTQKTEAGRFLSSKSDWSTERVPRQPGLHKKKPYFKKQKKNHFLKFKSFSKIFKSELIEAGSGGHVFKPNRGFKGGGM